jgi:hypothetical protein
MLRLLGQFEGVGRLAATSPHPALPDQAIPLEVCQVRADRVIGQVELFGQVVDRALTATQQQRIWLLSIFIIPGLVLGAGAYTWWTAWAGARQRNVGWRIDYANVNARLRPRVKKTWILPDVPGSDHCPVGLELR